MLRLVAWFAAAALVIAGACSDPHIDDAAEFLSQARAADCEASTRCGLFQTVDQCVAFEHQRRHGALYPWHPALAPDYLDAVERGTVAYSPSEAAMCVAQLRRRSCDRYPRSGQASPPACDRALVGVVSEGGVAHSLVECEPRRGFDRDPDCVDSCCEGTCGSRLVGLGVEGEPCDVAGIELCALGFVCDDRVCRLGPGAGEPCDTDWDCGQTRICFDGKCDRPRRLGEACVTSHPTAVLREEPCERVDEVCIGSPPTCQALRRRGEACGQDGQVCGHGLGCDSASHRCAGFAEEGEPCPASCRGDLWCGPSPDSRPDEEPTEPTCQAPRPDGATCRDSAQCASDFCDPQVSTCATRGPCP